MEQNTRDATIQQQKMIIETQQRENIALREMLAARGIQFDNELENRKAVLSRKPKREDHSMTPPSMSTLSPPSIGRPGGYSTAPPIVGSVASGYTPQNYLNGGAMSAAGHTPGSTQYASSPAGPEINEFTIKREHEPVRDMPGIFEREPQLGIDFILK
jgi:hypothetical protein